MSINRMACQGGCMVDHRSGLSGGVRTGQPLAPSPGSISAPRRVGPLVLWMAGLVVGTLAFHALGTGHLAPPPASPSGWAGWAAGRDPLLATVAVLRLVVLALAWYLVGATSLGLLVRLLRAARLVRLADALTIPMVRRMLQGAMGLTMATAVVTATMPTVDPDRMAVSSASTQPAEVGWDGPVGSPTVTGVNRDAIAEPGLVRPHPDGGALILRGADARSAEEEPADPPPASDALTLRPRPLETDGSREQYEADPQVLDQVHEHEVRAGESFWSIAEGTVASSLGRPPTEAEVRDHWQALVAANQDRLAVAGDADLIFPGQRFVVPAVRATPDAEGSGS